MSADANSIAFFLAATGLVLANLATSHLTPSPELQFALGAVTGSTVGLSLNISHHVLNYLSARFPKSRGIKIANAVLSAPNITGVIGTVGVSIASIIENSYFLNGAAHGLYAVSFANVFTRMWTETKYEILDMEIPN